MGRRNAPLTPTGRLRLIRRCQTRPIAHVAAEAGVSRQCLSKWVGRWRLHGEAGLADRRSSPATSLTRLDRSIVARIWQLRRDRKLSAWPIAVELAADDIAVSVATETNSPGRAARTARNRRADKLVYSVSG